MALGSLGAVAYDVVAKDKTAVGLDSASDRFRKIGTVAGAAMTGIGAAMTVMTDKARKMNAPLEAMAIQLGTNSKELRDMALEIGNVTFPLEEVISSMDLLTRAGMRNKEEMAVTATAFDTLGDATGKSASEITTIMIPAFNAFDIELKDAGNYIDDFTHMQRNTTIEMGDFSSMLKYIAPDIKTLGITLAESVGIMEALADKGIQGSSATREFRTAISAATSAPEKLAKATANLVKAEEALAKAQKDGSKTIDAYKEKYKDAKAAVDNAKSSTDAFYSALGLTKAEVEAYTERLDQGAGMTQEYADAMNTQYGFMDKLKYGVSELTLKYGSMLQPVEALGPAMTALGPAMIMISNINMGKIIPSLAALKVALLTNPIFLIVAVVAGVIVALVLLEKKFGVLSKAVELAGNAFGIIVEFFTGAFTTAVSGAQSIIGLFGDKLLFFLGPIGAVIYAFKHWEEIAPMIMGALSTIYDIITAPFMKAYDWITSLPSKFMEAGKNLIQAITDGIIAMAKAPYNAVRSALGPLGKLLPEASNAKEGPLSNLEEAGKKTITTFSEGITSASEGAANSFSAGIAPMAPAATPASSGGDTYGGDTISIGNVSLSKDYDFPALMKDIEAYQSQKRVQRGIRTI